MGLVVTSIRGSILSLYEQVRLIIFARKVNPAMLYIPWVKATPVNGSGAAELSHFRVGAAERESWREHKLEKKKGWGGRVKEWVEKTETAKMRQKEGMRRGRGRGGGRKGYR